jgi:glucans biosynthesis protein
LAIDTAVASGEVFPIFREFYIEKPKKNASNIVVHALLDSQKVSGAYRFDIHPGENTEIRVDATIYPRETVERLGLAPLTSMFLYGENYREGFDDFRPEVHDSDGLLVRFGNGEQLWRPLQNPDRLELSILRSQSIKGFGLMQRDRRPFSYEDLESNYDVRPSVWIEPENFDSGAVYLIEIPSREEINDNIVAFFTPEKKIEPGVPLTFSYKMFWGNFPVPYSVATVASTRIGGARLIGVPDEKQPLPHSARKFVIDFASPGVQSSFEPEENVEAVVTAASGTVTNVRVQPNLFLKGYRAVFDFVPQGTKPIELRCFLRKKGAALSETWSYRFSPVPEKQVFKMGS